MVRDRWRTVYETLPWPGPERPWDVAEFIDALGRQRGRRLTYIPIETGGQRTCGLSLLGRDSDLVIAAADCSSVLALTYLMHEIYHVLWPERRRRSSSFGGAERRGPSLARRLLPDVPEGTLDQLGSATISAAAERAADDFATCAVARVARHQRNFERTNGVQLDRLRIPDRSMSAGRSLIEMQAVLRAAL